MNKVIDKGFRSCRFVSTIVKHPVSGVSVRAARIVQATGAHELMKEWVLRKRKKSVAQEHHQNNLHQ